MRDYAETVQAMRYAFEQPCYDCVLGEKCNWGDFCFFKRAADAIEELLAELTTIRKQLPHWISVEDELPKNAGQMCLVCAKNSFGQQSVFNAFTGYGDFNWYTYDTTKMRSRLDNNNAIALGWGITHWMPLPEPPKGGIKQNVE